MRKLNLLLFAVAGILMSAMSVFAQPGAATAPVDNNIGLKALAAGIGFAIAVFGGAIGQSRIGAAANPGAAGRIQTMMILGLALIESLVLFALVIVFIKT